MTLLNLLLLVFLPVADPGASTGPGLRPACPEPDALAMFRQWSRSASPELRIQAARVLRGRIDRDSRVALLSLLDDEHAAVRAAARTELVARPASEAAALVADVSVLKKPRAREEAVRVVVARREDPTALLADPAPSVRARVLACGLVPPDRARAALRDPDSVVRALALEALPDIAAARTRARDPAEPVRIACARVLATAADLGPLVRDKSWRVRLAAIRRAEGLRDAALLPALIGCLEREPPGRVRARLVATLEGLAQVPFGDDTKRWRSWWAGRAADAPLPPPRKKRGPDRTAARIAFRKIPVVSHRVCFVLDASRSMEKVAPGKKGKTRWQLVVRDLTTVVDGLPRGAAFNVILFRTGVEAWSKRLQPATRGAKARCRRWIEKAKPAGWTNLFDAVAVALEDDKVDALYILTDGVPSRGAERTRTAILQELAYRNRYKLVQINCVQAGGSEGLSKAWRGFLEDLAKAHDGRSVAE